GWLPPASRGDLWGCVGLWYSGAWDSGNARYIAEVKRAVRTAPWRAWGPPAMTKPFTWQDGERTIRFGRGTVATAEELLGTGFTLLTTPRGEGAAPAV